MNHLCEQVVESATYLQSAGMSREQLSQLHHFSLKGRLVSFAQTCDYFSVSKDLKQNNIRFAERLNFVASEHRRSKQGLSLLVQQALVRWPL
jgi:hypothetical protein